MEDKHNSQTNNTLPSFTNERQQKNKELFLKQHGGIGRHALFAPGEAQSLGGGGLDADLVGVAAYNAGKALLHGGYVRVHLRAFGTDGSVYIAQAVALGGNEFNGLRQDNLAVHVERFV